MDRDHDGAGRLRDLSRRVGGSVVDYNDLVRLGGRFHGCTDGGQSAWELVLLIIGWNNKRKHRSQTVAAVQERRISDLESPSAISGRG